MKTLVISPRFSPDSQYLWKKALEADWGVHRAIRFRPPEGTEPSLCCCYGELMFCDIMAQTLDLGLLDPPDDWLANLPERYLKRRVSSMSLKRAVAEITQRAFIKPANDKMFPAQVYESGAHIPVRYVDPECPILVSDIVSFDAEVRCYVLDRKIVTASTYHKAAGLNLDTTKGGVAWLNLLLQDKTIPMPSGLVIDVGLVFRRGWVVIEANQAYASGIYEEADGLAILDLVARTAGHRSLVRPEDEPYLRTLHQYSQ